MNKRKEQIKKIIDGQPEASPAKNSKEKSWEKSVSCLTKD